MRGSRDQPRRTRAATPLTLPFAVALTLTTVGLCLAGTAHVVGPRDVGKPRIRDDQLGLSAKNR